jgi:hypothetical protein
MLMLWFDVQITDVEIYVDASATTADTGSRYFDCNIRCKSNNSLIKN